MAISQKDYSEKWSSSSNFYLEDGTYEWAIKELENYKNILEIGCGTGQSTLTLLRTNHNVFAIDNRIECLKKCKELILSEGYARKIISLETKIEFPAYDAKLLLLDVLKDFDARMLRYLDAEAIILWFPGGHSYQSYTKENEIIYDMINYVVEYAESKRIPFQIMQRFSNLNSVSLFWENVKRISKYSKSKIKNKDFKYFCGNGIKLYDDENPVADGTITKISVGTFFPTVL